MITDTNAAICEAAFPPLAVLSRLAYPRFCRSLRSGGSPTPLAPSARAASRRPSSSRERSSRLGRIRGSARASGAAASRRGSSRERSSPLITAVSSRDERSSVSVRQVVGGGGGSGANVGEVAAERRHVTDLTAGTESLAVQVDLDVRPACHSVV